MRDRLWIFAGLLLFIAAFSTPFWHALLHAHAAARGPDLQLPINKLECVAPVSYMRSSHMHLLFSWRESAVREGNRTYVSFDHKTYQKSLTKTCWQCHSRERFCDRCHSYSGVSTPYCWNCHNEPQSQLAWRTLP